MNIQKRYFDIICAAVLAFVCFSCESTPAVPDDGIVPESAAEQSPEIPVPLLDTETEIPETDADFELSPADDADVIDVSGADAFAEPAFVIEANGIDTASADTDGQTASDDETAASSDTETAQSENRTASVLTPDTEKQSAAPTDSQTAANATTQESSDASSAETVAPAAGIWEYEPEAGSVRDTQETAKNPSRTAEAHKGTLLEVRYPGKGWVFLGDVAHSSCITYRTKLTDNGDSVFVFMPTEAGKAQLSFFRYDTLKNEYEDDILDVAVSADPAAEGRTYAPPYIPAQPVAAESVLQSAPKSEQRAPLSSSQPATSSASPAVQPEVSRAAEQDNLAADGISDEPELQIDVSSSEPAPADVHLNELSAKELRDAMETALKNGNASGVIDASLVYVQSFSDNLDYVHFMTGQAYELAGDMRNIKKAMESYQFVVSAFPYSPYWHRADERIKYIERFYFTIR